MTEALLNKDEEQGDDHVDEVEDEVPDGQGPAMIHYDYVEPPPTPDVAHVPLDHVFQPTQESLAWQ